MYRFKSISVWCLFFLGGLLAFNVYCASPLTIADAGPDQIVFDEVVLDGSDSFDAAEPIISYEWQLNHTDNPAYDRVATGKVVTVSYLYPGFYQVTLTVRTADDRTAQDQILVSAIGHMGDFDGDFDVDGEDLELFTSMFGFAMNQDDVDDDNDNYTENQGDCDDNDASINPSAVDICDDIDQNCDGSLDCPLDTDDDGDGYSEQQGDCNDADDTIHPNAQEQCDEIDHNCDGDSACPENIDNDGDGFTENTGDCNDADDSIHPAATEICDGIDNDCIGGIDNLPPRPCGDQGVCAEAVERCIDGSWQCEYSSIYEQNQEQSCRDSRDNDCDGGVDLEDPECRAFNNTCETATYIGSVAADDGCTAGPVISRWGNSWIRVRGEEASSLTSPLHFNAEIQNPTGVTYRMTLYESCGGSIVSMSGSVVAASWEDTLFANDDKYFYIKIERISGTSTEDWTIRTFGDCP